MSRRGEKVHNKVVFKEYVQDQLMIPMSLDNLIPDNHIVRVVNRAIDNMKLKALLEKYPGGGRSSFHPIMMTKLIVYAYTDRNYSCRRIAKAARENIMYMWLCGRNTPDFKTINTFRSERMKDVIMVVFAEVIELLIKEKYVALENYFLDGTKIEANANKYSWVWGNSTKRYKNQLQEKCERLFEQIDLENEKEDKQYGDNDIENNTPRKEIDSETLNETIRRIDERLEKQPDKKLKKVKKIIEKDYLPRMEKYEQQLEILEERNSYSKTDHDATFMRMKEDHMKNGQLKPGYNVQIGTEDQFILAYSIHQRPGDTSCMKEHLEQAKEMMSGTFPNNIIADAGYGSEENYEYLEEHEIQHYVKYNTFHKEASKKWKDDPTKIQNFRYDSETDQYFCPCNRPFVFMWEQNRKSDNGYQSRIRVYECLNCAGCEYRDKCLKTVEDSFANRRININRNLDAYKEKAKKNLTSEIGQKMRSLRPVEVESVFGNIKGNFSMRRFMLKGLAKVNIEWGLFSIAHNMRKMAAHMG